MNECLYICVTHRKSMSSMSESIRDGGKTLRGSTTHLVTAQVQGVRMYILRGFAEVLGKALGS